MKVINKIDFDFYLPLLFKTWLIFCLVYLFMIFQFWWGNHDWNPLSYGIKWHDGLFEARYSQHLFTVWFLNGQILPALYVIIALGLLSLLCLLAANYLCLEKNERAYLLFVLLLGSSPYIFVLFHYVFITVPMIMWGSVLVGVLWLAEGKHNFRKMIACILGFALTLGGYPPNISFTATMFCGRKIILYQNKKQNLRQIFGDGVFLGTALVAGYGINRLIIYILTNYLGFYFQMYNMRTSSFVDIIQKIPQEFLHSFQAIGGIYTELGLFYASFLSIICLCAVIRIFQTVPNKLIGLILLSVLCLATRIAYLVAENAELASFRIGYWSFLGISAIALSVLLNVKKQIAKNMVFALSIVALFSFIKVDYEIQKTVAFKFRLERLFHKRLEDRVFSYPQFDIKAVYATLNFGYPDFLYHVCTDGCPKFNNEILDNTVLPADLGYVLFWDEVDVPVSQKLGIWGKRFWLVSDPILKGGIQILRPSNIEDVGIWLYAQSKTYPNQQSIYVDDQYLFFNLDEKFFNQNRELLNQELRRELP